MWTASTNVEGELMTTNETVTWLPDGQQRVTAEQWFASGRRIPYDPDTARILTEEQAAANPSALRIFQRVVAATPDPDATWLTLLPGFPDGSYGWAQVDRLLGDHLGPRLYVEPVGQGDSDKPPDYPYSSIERADLIEAVWRHHDVRRTVVITFDYTSLALLELLRRRLERTHAGEVAMPEIVAVFMVNGGLFADAHTHPWQGTPLLRTRLGALGMQRAQFSPRVFDTAMKRARLYSRGYRPTAQQLTDLRSAVLRRDGAAFLHNAAGFVAEHRRQAQRWDLAAIARELPDTVALYVGGSAEDPYEHRQIQATRERVPRAEILTFPGGHLTTSEHPDLLAAAVTEIATRHGVGAEPGFGRDIT
jgi:pimeloyl-ACP methyl ester carboxylesterase